MSIIKTEEQAMKVSVNHMWRHSSGLDLSDQIAVREFRVARYGRLNAPPIIMDHEIKALNALLRKQAREALK